MFSRASLEGASDAASDVMSSLGCANVPWWSSKLSGQCSGLKIGQVQQVSCLVMIPNARRMKSDGEQRLFVKLFKD